MRRRYYLKMYVSHRRESLTLTASCIPNSSVHWYFYYSSNGRALFFKNGRSPASHRRRTIRLEHLIAKPLYGYPNHVVSSGYFDYLSSQASVPHARIFNTPAFAILKEGQHGLF